MDILYCDNGHGRYFVWCKQGGKRAELSISALELVELTCKLLGWTFTAAPAEELAHA